MLLRISFLTYFSAVFKDAIQYYHTGRQSTVVDWAREKEIREGRREKKPHGGKRVVTAKLGRPPGASSGKQDAGVVPSTCSISTGVTTEESGYEYETEMYEPHVSLASFSTTASDTSTRKTASDTSTRKTASDTSTMKTPESMTEKAKRMHKEKLESAGGYV
jgi:hypothetical protein